jgi:hypothetical protein
LIERTSTTTVAVSSFGELADRARRPPVARDVLEQGADARQPQPAPAFSAFSPGSSSGASSRDGRGK